VIFGPAGRTASGWSRPSPARSTGLVRARWRRPAGRAVQSGLGWSMRSGACRAA